MLHKRYKNLIFDLGGVIFQWEPKRFVSDARLPDSYADVFQTPLWLEHDSGEQSREEVIAHLPPSCDQTQFRGFVSGLTQRMQPIQPMIELFYQLKEQGFKIYLLSNMPEEMYEELRQLHSIFQDADGEVISFQVGQLKPMLPIYQTLLSKYALDPHACLFVDDREENVVAGQKVGIDGIICCSPEQVKRELIARGFRDSCKTPRL